MSKMDELNKILDDFEMHKDYRIINLFRSTDKENINLKRANEYKFHEIERLNNQVNDLQKERDELLARNIHITNILDSDKFRRAKWIYTGTDTCFKDPDALKETQAAAQRILDKENE